MAAKSASVKIAHRISSGSSNISRSNSSLSHSTSKSSPCISRNNSSSLGTSESRLHISSGTSNISDRSRNRSTSGISRDISHSTPHSIQGGGVQHAFVSEMASTGIFDPSAVQYLLHRTRVFLTRTWACKLPHVHILEATPILRAELHHYHSQPPRRRTRMDHPFRLSPPRALSPTTPP